MSLSSTSRFRKFNCLGFFAGILIAAPLGYGVPYIVGENTSASLGMVLLVVLVGPSIVIAARVTNLFGYKLSSAVYGLGGFVVAPILQFLILVSIFLLMDWTCESWSLGCDLSMIWQVAGLFWGMLVLLCLSAAYYLDQHSPTNEQ
ncbi:hypothetical protein [Kallotenue papyrolyticum]|uniref:hypothetical protein n=1 Tax=Kallotenue papyrolyticum TaxID=1325125 RepID=UPI0012680D0F|nr:hypothetical protein [Kallotenue papyrolyticum]